MRAMIIVLIGLLVGCASQKTGIPANMAAYTSDQATPLSDRTDHEGHGDMQPSVGAGEPLVMASAQDSPKHTKQISKTSHKKVKHALVTTIEVVNMSIDDVAIAPATHVNFEPKYVVSGLCKPLTRNGPPQTLTLAISLFMDEDRIMNYVAAIEKLCTKNGPGDGKTVYSGKLKDFDNNYVNLRAVPDCGDKAVIKCELQNGLAEVVAVSSSDSVPMLWRWNVQAIGGSVWGETRQISIVISGAKKDAEFKHIDSIPDVPVPLSIDPVGVVKWLEDATNSTKGMLVALAGVIVLLWSWYKAILPLIRRVAAKK